jgi:hypothetical protein
MNQRVPDVVANAAAFEASGWLQIARTHRFGAPGRTRTYDARFRKPTLYPLSYEGLGR